MLLQRIETSLTWLRSAESYDSLAMSVQSPLAEHPQVLNAASELLVTAFGDDGRHVRSAVGVSSLPLGSPLEIELTVSADLIRSVLSEDISSEDKSGLAAVSAASVLAPGDVHSTGRGLLSGDASTWVAPPPHDAATVMLLMDAPGARRSSCNDGCAA